MGAFYDHEIFTFSFLPGQVSEVTPLSPKLCQ